jgi:hypothetical protein
VYELGTLSFTRPLERSVRRRDIAASSSHSHNLRRFQNKSSTGASGATKLTTDLDEDLKLAVSRQFIELVSVVGVRSRRHNPNLNSTIGSTFQDRTPEVTTTKCKFALNEPPVSRECCNRD